MDDDKPFNPFYIGPHPSMACAVTETPPRQCSPDCPEKDGEGGKAESLENASSSGAQGTKDATNSNNTGEKANDEPPCCTYPCREGRN
ncbi:uncharacterized protein LOC117779686 [Drosophila innubila]|uniref:uncharacterized protein LOC117779686 n=1 Tax=Drosophila innubila TaxID=198719 RepID=UPI00148E2598|nr:uncharacterized protein LOC117779686 [Drosophila innubila]